MRQQICVNFVDSIGGKRNISHLISTKGILQNIEIYYLDISETNFS